MDPWIAVAIVLMGAFAGAGWALFVRERFIRREYASDMRHIAKLDTLTRVHVYARHSLTMHHDEVKADA